MFEAKGASAQTSDLRETAAARRPCPGRCASAYLLAGMRFALQRVHAIAQVRATSLAWRRVEGYSVCEEANP